MIIKNAEFIKSASEKGGFLDGTKPIIAVAGKSNVGKSSFINMLADRKKLARTSNTPGRTRLVNYFDFGEFILADLPGYGFASVSKTEKAKWGVLMQDFFHYTDSLIHTFSLIDIRHDPTKEDMQMMQFMYASNKAFSLVATKSDKLGKSKIKPQITKIANVLKVGSLNITATSSLDKRGKIEVLDKIEKILALHNQEEE